MKERDSLFDNLRAFLIFTVVLGHLLRENIGNSTVLYTLYTFMYLFHMAGFVFISGYFSKNVEKCRNNAFESFLIPFVILDIVCFIKGTLLHEDIVDSFHLLEPMWGLWFFLALFVWKFFLKDLIKIRFILPISFAVGLLSGFTGASSLKMALGRILAFLPFFLLGYYCTPEIINKIRRIPKLCSIVSFGTFFGIACLSAKYKLLDSESLFLRSSYKESGTVWYLNSDFHQRIFIYAAALLLTASLINIMTRKSTVFSYIGQNSVTVYIIHLLVVPTFKRLPFFENSAFLYFLYCLVVTILITGVCALPFVKNGYDTIMNRIKNVILKQPGTKSLPSGSFPSSPSSRENAPTPSKDYTTVV